MHGHGFEVILHADQDIGESDYGLDYDRIDDIWAPLCTSSSTTSASTDRRPGNPTSAISAWLWHRLKPCCPSCPWVTVYETGSCGANFDGQNHRIWKEMTFDSAIRLKNAPEGQPLRGIHGHTWALLRLHLNAAGRGDGLDGRLRRRQGAL